MRAYPRSLWTVFVVSFPFSSSGTTINSMKKEFFERMKTTAAIENQQRGLLASDYADKVAASPALAYGGPSKFEMADIELQLMEQAFNGDVLGSFRNMLLSFQEINDLWADTRVFRALLENVPMLRSLKGVDAIAAKNEEDVTVDDAIKSVGLFRSFLFKSLDVIESMRDPEVFATKMYEYATTKDAEILKLMERIERGDHDANNELHKAIVARELGDLIDLDYLGFDGTEPEFLKAAKATAKGDDAKFWDGIMDSTAKKYMDDPLLAFREAKQFMEGY